MQSLGETVLGQLRSELRKTYSTKLWWALLIPAALLNLLVNLVTSQGNAIAFTAPLGMALGLGYFSTKLAVIYGVICATSEDRHRTISTTYLAEPRRLVSLGAKALVAAAVGAVYGMASVLAGMLGILFAGGLGETSAGGLLAVGAGAIVVFALWAALGVGVGTLLNSQIAAIISVLVYLMMVEPIVGAFLRSDFTQAEQYLPDGAANGVLSDLATDGSLTTLLTGAGTPWWLALLIFASYVAVALVAGAAAAQRRDIT
jgi:hypothetical protein